MKRNQSGASTRLVIFVGSKSHPKHCNTVDVLIHYIPLFQKFKPAETPRSQIKIQIYTRYNSDLVTIAVVQERQSRCCSCSNGSGLYDILLILVCVG